MALTRLGYVVVKRETTQGSAVTPTHFLRFKDGDVTLKKDVIINDPIQNNRAKALYPVRGKETVAGTYKFDLEANECVHFLSAAIGALTSTDISSATDASVYSHSMKPASTIYPLTIEQGKGNLTDTTSNRQNYTVERTFGAVVDSFTISGKDNIIEFSGKIKALGQFRTSLLTGNAASSGSTVVIGVQNAQGLTTSDAINVYDTTPQNETHTLIAIVPGTPTVSVSSLTNSYTTANTAKIELLPMTPSYGTAPQYFSFGHAKAQFGATLSAAASAAADNIENWDITFDNKAKELYGTAQTPNHFGPNVLAPLGFEIKVKFTRYFTNVADRDIYLNMVQQALILTISNGVIVSATDTNNATYQVQVKLPDLRITTHEMPTGTDDLYAVKVECEAFYDVSNSESLQVIVQNAKIGTTYTA